LIALCLLASPEAAEFDYEAYREDSSEERRFTEGLSAARLREIQEGDTLTLEEMRNWRACRFSLLLDFWSIGVGYLYEVRDSVDKAVYALHLVSGGGYEYQEWFFGPWSTLEAAQHDMKQRGAFTGWLPGSTLPQQPEEIAQAEIKAGVWSAYEEHPRCEEAVRLFPVLIEGKTGFIDSGGRLVIPPCFAGWGYDKWAAVFGPIGEFDEGLAPVWFGDRTGYIDSTGRIVVPPRFVRAAAFSEGLAAVQIGDIVTEERLGRNNDGYRLETVTNVPAGQWGYINGKGENITAFQFDLARPFREGLGLVHDQGKWGYIDRFGNSFIRPRWDDAGPFCKGLAAVRKEGAWGFIGRDGEYVVPPKFKKANEFSFDLAAVSRGRKWGYIDSTGAVQIDCRFDDAANFSDSLAAVKCGALTGFIDRCGQFVIPPELDEASSFSEGLAAARASGSWGFISPSGQWAIQPRFDRVNNFRHGLAAVQQSGRWGYINSTGEFVWAPTR
jgi:hypothetical protein